MWINLGVNGMTDNFAFSKYGELRNSGLVAYHGQAATVRNSAPGLKQEGQNLYKMSFPNVSIGNLLLNGSPLKDYGDDKVINCVDVRKTDLVNDTIEIYDTVSSIDVVPERPIEKRIETELNRDFGMFI